MALNIVGDLKKIGAPLSNVDEFTWTPQIPSQGDSTVTLNSHIRDVYTKAIQPWLLRIHEFLFVQRFKVPHLKFT